MAGLEIVDFDPAYRADFKRLNVEWLERYFVVEPIDETVLGDPEQYILAPGGVILFARRDHEIVGTCALKHQGEGVYELTKMGVTRRQQKGGIGAALIEAAIDRFKTLGGAELYLETSSLLIPAIKLYARYGFVDQGQRKPGSVYAHSDVYMIWRDSDVN